MKAFLWVFFLHSTSAIPHSLKYFSEGSSGHTKLPGFVYVGELDGVEIFHYDSNNGTLQPTPDWIRIVKDDDLHFWTEERHNFVRYQHWSILNLQSLREHFNQSGGVHVLQRIHGCEWDNETGHVDGFMKYAYDGEDFLAFDLKTQTWSPPEHQTLITKHFDDTDETGDIELNLSLSQECPKRLRKYLAYGNSSLLRTEVPSVFLLQRSPGSPISCLATGFFPNKGKLFWRKDGKELQRGVDIGKSLPNHDGTFQIRAHLNLSSDEDWHRYQCVFQLSGVKEEVVTTLDKAAVRSNSAPPAPTHGCSTGTIIIIIVVVIIVALLLLCVIGFFMYKKKPNCCKGASHHDSVAGVSTEERRESSSSGTDAVPHSLKYFSEGSSGLTELPEFVYVVELDGVEIFRYDSNTRTLQPTQNWIHTVKDDDDPDLGTWGRDNLVHRRHNFKVNIESLQGRFNQNGGVHVLQRIHGCEWDDETGHADGFMKYAYDGEDFLVFDLKNKTWWPREHQTLITKHLWDNDRTGIIRLHYFLSQECPKLLRKYLAYGNSSPLRTEVPSEFLLQRSPESPISCLATGFFPNKGKLFWRKDGEELQQGVDIGKSLPNHDGTFQISADLDPPPHEDWHRYQCVFQLPGIEEEVVTTLDKAAVRSNSAPSAPTHGWSTGTIVLPVVGALLLLCAAGVFIYKKLQNCWKRASHHVPLAGVSTEEKRESSSSGTDADSAITISADSEAPPPEPSVPLMEGHVQPGERKLGLHFGSLKDSSIYNPALQRLSTSSEN